MNYVGKICPYCKTEFKEDDDVVVCSVCEMPHHKECWIENKACTTFGCTGTIIGIENYNDILFCPRCGAPYKEGEAICSSCGNVFFNSGGNAAQSVYSSGGQQYVENNNSPYTSNAQGNGAYNSQSPYGSNTQGNGAYYSQPQYGNNTQGNGAYYSQPQYGSNTQGSGAYYSQSPYTSYNQGSNTGGAQSPYTSYNGANYRNPNIESMDKDTQLLVGHELKYYALRFRNLEQDNGKVSWNWASAFLSIFWFAYRKMYKAALIYYFIFFVIKIIIPKSTHLGLSFLIDIASFFICGIYGNYFYKRQVDKYLEISKNMDEFERYDYLKRHGGTSNGAVWAVIGITIFVALIRDVIISPF